MSIPICHASDDLVRHKLPPHVKMVRNPVGREYFYLTVHRGTARAAKSHRLPDDPRSPAFWAEYTRLLGLPPESAPRTDTVVALDRAWGGDPANGEALFSRKEVPKAGKRSAALAKKSA